MHLLKNVGHIINRMVLVVIIALVCSTLYLQSAFADQTEAENEVVSPQVVAEEGAVADPPVEETLYDYETPIVEETSYGWMIFKALFIIALIVLGFYFFVRYLTRHGAIASSGAGVLSTVAVMPLGTNKQIQVVEVGSRVLVLGVCDSNISLLKEVSDRDEIDRIKLQSSRSVTVQEGGFQHFLKGQIETFIDFVQKNNKTSGSSRQQKSEDAVPTDNFEQMVVSSVRDEERVTERKFFDDERIEYMRKQRSRLREINRYDEE
ncbi:MAG: flagellar biosynthetic protein FliO [Spirochaetes bacterium]|jgi:flagellar biosynthetic protein FliO|nr:flagellar biosynthetic protein FliO [Spirochaetota bacterium]